MYCIVLIITFRRRLGEKWSSWRLSLAEIAITQNPQDWTCNLSLPDSKICFTTHRSRKTSMENHTKSAPTMEAFLAAKYFDYSNYHPLQVLGPWD